MHLLPKSTCILQHPMFLQRAHSPARNLLSWTFFNSADGAIFLWFPPVVLAFRRPLRARRSGASENGECRPRIPSGRISPYDTAVTRDLIWVGTVRLQHRERFQECLRVPRSHLGCLGVPVCPCPRFRFITSAQAKHSLR